MLLFLLWEKKKKKLEKQKEQHQKEIHFISPLYLKFPNTHFTTTSCSLVKKAEPGIYFIKYLGIS